MPIPQKDIDLIADRADIVEIVSDYVRLEQRGKRFWGLSPFKSEKTPSFCVDSERGLYYCFSTHQGGTVFNFLMSIDHISFPDAVDTLAKRYNISYQRSGDQHADGQEQSGRNTLLELYARVTDSFHYLLTNSDEASEARRYLELRGLSAETIATFKIGYCRAQGNWLWGFLTGKRYTPELLQRSGLFRARHHDRALFAGRIIFPITNRKDEVIGFGARSPHGDAQPKYINSPETIIFKKRNELFGKLRAAMRATRPIDGGQGQSLYLVEGYMDALALYQSGIANTAAALGTAFSTEQARSISRITNSIVLLFDADQAGRSAVERAGRILQQMEIEVYVCQLPEGTDPGELLRTSEDFRKNCRQFLARHTKGMLEYLLEDAFPDKQLASSIQSNNALRQIFEYISFVSTIIRRELYLEQIADYLNVDRGSVLHDFEAWFSGWQKRRAPRAIAERNVSGNSPPSATQRTTNLFETDCMAMSICCMKEFPYLRAIIDQQCFESKAARYLYELQERAFQNGVADSREVIEMIEHSRLKDYVIRITMERSSTDCERTVVDIAHRLKKRHLLRERAKQIALLRTLERDSSLDSKFVQDVQLEIMYLNKEILKQ